MDKDKREQFRKLLRDAGAERKSVKAKVVTAVIKEVSNKNEIVKKQDGNIEILLKKADAAIAACQQNYKDAAGLYQKAAEQGDARAQYELGWLYRFGHGVKKDFREAEKWFREAAAQGHKDAQSYLKKMTKRTRPKKLKKLTLKKKKK